MKNKMNYFNILAGVIILVFFILISYILQTNLSLVEKIMNYETIGIYIYVFVTILATVVAPISAVPLLPVAVLLWGWINAAILSVIAWTIGSVIAFALSRKYGVKIVSKFVSLERIKYYESFIPKKDLFLGIILMRIFLPVDILSYLLGIFSRVGFWTYSIATFIGVIPFAIILSYVGSLSILYQVLSFVIGGFLFLVLYYKVGMRLKKKVKV